MRMAANFIAGALVSLHWQDVGAGLVHMSSQPTHPPARPPDFLPIGQRVKAAKLLASICSLANHRISVSRSICAAACPSKVSKLCIHGKDDPEMR